jgi:DNA end-binding protein Ku
MAADWSADQFRDSFRDEIMKLVESKAKAGETETVTPVEDAPSSGRSADVIDLTELLKRSLQVGKAADAPAKKTPAKKAAAKAPAKKTAAGRSTARRAA